MIRVLDKFEHNGQEVRITMTEMGDDYVVQAQYKDGSSVNGKQFTCLKNDAFDALAALDGKDPVRDLIEQARQDIIAA